MTPDLPNIPSGRPVRTNDVTGQRVRCFVTKIEAEAPTRSLWAAIVTYTADHAYGTFHGSFYTMDGRAYSLGDVLWVTVER